MIGNRCKSAEETKTCLSLCDVKMVTHIGDRESDIFEEFARVPSKNHHLLIRVAQNRRLKNQSESLYTYLSQQPCEGTYTPHSAPPSVTPQGKQYI